MRSVRLPASDAWPFAAGLVLAAMAASVGCSELWGFSQGQPASSGGHGGSGVGGGGGSGAGTLPEGGCGGDEQVVLRDGLGEPTEVTADTTLVASLPDSRSGGHHELSLVPEESSRTVVLLRFDLSSVAAGTELLQAQLWLFAVDCSGCGLMATGELVAYPVLESWSEAEATWNERRAATAWTTPGAGSWWDGSVTPAGLTAGTIDPLAPIRLSLDPDLVRSWIDESETNHGVALVVAGDGASLHSSESETATLRPTLELTIRRCQ